MLSAVPADVALVGLVGPVLSAVPADAALVGLVGPVPSDVCGAR